MTELLPVHAVRADARLRLRHRGDGPRAHLHGHRRLQLRPRRRRHARGVQLLRAARPPRRARRRSPSPSSCSCSRRSLGLVAERLLRRFQGADYATSLVVTIALTVGLLGFAQKRLRPRRGPQRAVPVRRPPLRGARRADHLRPHRPGRRRRRGRLRSALPALRHAARRADAGGRRRPRAGPPQRRPLASSSPGSAG